MHKYIHTYKDMQRYVSINVCLQHTYIHIHIYTQTCTNSFQHIYIHITHTYIPIHIYMGMYVLMYSIRTKSIHGRKTSTIIFLKKNDTKT